tara:strand:- start:372 stop:524 length:153 start_codon:yes stop_codon:yes gene_type:complete
VLTKLNDFPINQISKPILEVGVEKKLTINNIKELVKDFYKNNYISNFLEK